MKTFVLASLTALALVGAAEAQTAQPVDVQLTNYAFAPSTLNLKAGTTYRLHLVNASTKGHDFTAKEFFAASQVAAADQAKIEDGEVEIPGSQTADITVTPSHAGTYPLTCSHFMHTMLGMKGNIVVQ
jgi:plastocyanin